VRNNADERVGEVNEVILSKDGKVAAVVLGIGEREVALTFPTVRVEPDNSATAMAASVIVKANLTKDTRQRSRLGLARAWREEPGTADHTPRQLDLPRKRAGLPAPVWAALA
jgi:hypothetical protein